MAETNLIAEPGKQDIVISREFDAPQDLVFRACTDPELSKSGKLLGLS